MARPRIAMSSYPVTSGVFTVVAAFMSLIFGVLLLMGSITTGYTSYGYTALYYPPPVLGVGILNMVGFIFGLPAGVLALRRRRGLLVVAGAALLMVAAISLFLLRPVQNWISGGIIVLFSVLGIVFTAVAHREFR